MSGGLTFRARRSGVTVQDMICYMKVCRAIFVSLRPPYDQMKEKYRTKNFAQ